ncbi:MAG TPA: DUF4240 domain-containing protein [Microbacterium sp.]|nr:DUF4240 domain-containing protein [Microbacterium sp.]
MNDVEFWSLIDTMGGELTDRSLRALRRELKRVEPAELLSFHERLMTQVDRLSPLGLVEYGMESFPAAGDGYAYFLHAVVAQGRDRVESLIEGGQAAVVDADSELGMELAGLAQGVFEKRTGELWPDDSGVEDDRVLVYVGGGSAGPLDGPCTDVEWGVVAALEQLVASESYSVGVVAAGCTRIEYYTEIFAETAKRPTRSVVRRKGSGLSVDIEINASGSDGTSFDDGVDRMRKIVDSMARRFGFPKARDVLGLARVEAGERPPDHERFDPVKHFSDPALPPEFAEFAQALFSGELEHLAEEELGARYAAAVERIFRSDSKPADE